MPIVSSDDRTSDLVLRAMLWVCMCDCDGCGIAPAAVEAVFGVVGVAFDGNRETGDVIGIEPVPDTIGESLLRLPVTPVQPPVLSRPA
jgi:hypothetical protein